MAFGKLARKVKRYYGIGRYNVKKRFPDRVFRGSLPSKRFDRVLETGVKLHQAHRRRQAVAGLVLLGAAAAGGAYGGRAIGGAINRSQGIKQRKRR